MNAARYQQIKSLFHSTLERRPEERPAFLRAEAGDDADLIVQVEALLSSHDRLDSFLEEPALKIKASDLAPALAAPKPSGEAAVDGDGPGDDDVQRLPPEDRVIGPYRLVELLGEGGMGSVYKAEQLQPVRRVVALKLIKLGMDTKEVVARFEAERQALALMDHPNIARVLDAGATPSGRPYFVMEHVPGIPITEHADRHGLNTHQRLLLFLEVCEAVHHAHQRAIIHRDLKPSNILVMFQNERAVPKIIDFGIAKATNQRLTEASLFTEQGRIIGTPEYMSPEQAEMTAQDVDIRTDVYSLGVILYELLSGTLPFSSAELRSSGYAGIQKTIREVEPPRPSNRVTTLGSDPKTTRSRSTDLRSLVRQLRGDLDWITMKAMAKARNERYPSAWGLAEDLRRFLADEPVSATRPSLRYRLGKFARRNRSVVAAIAAVVLALALGLLLALRAQGRLRDAQQALRDALATAEKEADRARDNELRAAAAQREAEANAELARANEQRAVAAAAEQARQLAENDLLVSDARVTSLLRQVDELWPMHPHRAPAMAGWLEQAEELAARLPEFVRARDRYPAAAAPSAAATGTLETVPAIAGRLVAELTAATAPAGAIAVIRARLDRARSVRAQSIDAFAEQWQRATAEVAADPRFTAAGGSSILTPQVDLVPLGKDPASGLQEFAVLSTGRPPERGGDGRLVIDGDSAVVVVLLPGGRVRVGAGRGDPTHDDPRALKHEGPVQELELEPFFIAKFEMTQAQWQRWTGENPSNYPAGTTVRGQEIGATNPVEQVTWHECERVLRQMGLELPTEAQWEYAARGGTATPWFTGATVGSLTGFVNLAGAEALPAWNPETELADESLVHAAAGAVAANPFGLHHMLGNVAEWCRDAYCSYVEHPPQAGSGLRDGRVGRQMVHRGGSYRDNASVCRCAARDYGMPGAGESHRGVRPARPLIRD